MLTHIFLKKYIDCCGICQHGSSSLCNGKLQMELKFNEFDETMMELLAWSAKFIDIKEVKPIKWQAD